MQLMEGSLIAHRFTILLLYIWLIFLIPGFAFNFLSLLEITLTEIEETLPSCLLNYTKAKNQLVH